MSRLVPSSSTLKNLLENIHYFNTVKMGLKYGSVIEGMLGQSGLLRPCHWDLKLGIIRFFPVVLDALL